MAKKNFDNVTAQLANQAKERFTPDDNIIKKNADIVVVNTDKKEQKKQKTIYLNKNLIKLLKKTSYIKDDLDQSEIVAIALERYFESEGIYLSEGE